MTSIEHIQEMGHEAAPIESDEKAPIIVPIQSHDGVPLELTEHALSHEPRQKDNSAGQPADYYEGA